MVLRNVLYDEKVAADRFYLNICDLACQVSFSVVLDKLRGLRNFFKSYLKVVRKIALQVNVNENWHAFTVTMLRSIFPLISAAYGALATFQSQFPVSPTLYSSGFVTPVPPTINTEFRAQYMQVRRAGAVL